MLLTFTGNNPSNPANNNRMDGYSYDAAGNLLNDGTNFYTYDAENRIIEVQQGSASGAVLATYEYDADGQRVHRTGVTTDTCDSAGVRDYVYDLAGHWILEVNNGGTYCKGEIYAAGRHLVSDADGNSIFDHSDWLGTARLRNNYANPTLFETCTSLPFGDALACAGGDLSTIHFTGKDRDAESGLDNFGARYNASNFGRFMTPDWSGDPDPVPYASMDAPQTLNLYAYVANNPIFITDPDGHWMGPGVDTPLPDPCPISSSWNLCFGGQDTTQIVRNAVDYLHQAWTWYRTSHVDPTCVAAATASGASMGAATGPEIGGVLGLAAGPAAEFTVPGGAAAGGLLGGSVGAAAGNLVGQAVCRVGSGGGGGGGGGGSGGGGKWKLGSFKSATKWANQLKARGWTEAQIDEAINRGQQFPATNNVNPANGATRFVNPTTGQSVVIDNVTQEVLHVGGPGFRY